MRREYVVLRESYSLHKFIYFYNVPFDRTSVSITILLNIATSLQATRHYIDNSYCCYIGLNASGPAAVLPLSTSCMSARTRDISKFGCSLYLWKSSYCFRDDLNSSVHQSHRQRLCTLAAASTWLLRERSWLLTRVVMCIILRQSPVLFLILSNIIPFLP